MRLLFVCGGFFMLGCQPSKDKNNEIPYLVSWKAVQLENCPRTRSGDAYILFLIEVINKSKNTLVLYNDNYPVPPGWHPSSFQLIVDSAGYSNFKELDPLEVEIEFIRYPNALKAANNLDNQMRLIAPGDTLMFTLFKGVGCMDEDGFTRVLENALDFVSIKYELRLNIDSIKQRYPGYHILDSIIIAKAADFRYKWKTEM